MIVFICGAINAGKSSVGKLLADKMDAAFIEGDDVRKFLSMLTVDEVRPAIVEGIVAVTRSFAKRGFPVVVAYPLWNDDYERLKEGLKGVKVPIRYIALNPHLEVALKDRGGREIGEWEINRIKELYEKGVNHPDFAESVDNSEMTAEECADYIYNMLKTK
jgi:chloramphenicol 3-O-phosphotransferase